MICLKAHHQTFGIIWRPKDFVSRKKLTNLIGKDSVSAQDVELLDTLADINNTEVSYEP